MQTTVAITQKWQLQIPKSVRNLVGLREPGMVSVKVEKKKIIITPEKSAILSLAGKHTVSAKKRKVDIDKIRDLIDYSNL